MKVRLWPVLALLAGLWLPSSAPAQEQSIPAPAHGKKKAKKGYDYDQSQYKAYHALNGTSHYHFDKDGNPIDGAPAKKLATKGKRKKKSAAPTASSSAAPAELAHAHFPGAVASPEAPPASAAPRSDGAAAGSAPMVGGSCQGDTCSQPPGGQ